MKKRMQTCFLWLIIGVLLTPASGRDPRTTAMAAQGGGIPLWVNTDPTNTITSVAVGDFNGDGRDDALAGSQDDNVYAINGATGEQLWNNTDPTGDVLIVAVGDFNGDGRDDALAGSEFLGPQPRATVYAINGSTGEQLWNNTDPVRDVVSVAVGDFNGDGRDDALVGSWDDNVYAINGATGVTLWTNTDPTNNIVSVAVGDFNGDGRDDALAGGDDTTVYAINGITGTQLWNYTAPTDAIRDIAVGDFNGDGRDDALTSCRWDKIHTIDGATGTSLWTFNATTSSTYRVAVGDFNGDGRDDALTGSDDTTIYAIDGNTGGVLWTNPAPTDVIRAVTVGDFNSDGTDDALAGSFDTNVYAINGRTGRTLWIYTGPTNWIYHLAVGDFNSDGVDDALAGSYDSNVYAIAGAAEAALSTTKLDVKLTVSKTYVNITGDWTKARAVVTNVGAFPAYGVRVIFHAPDDTDHVITYEEILPSRSETATWILTSGAGLPTVKNPDDAVEISYTLSVEVRAWNGPTALAEVAIIVDPPVESQSIPPLSEGIFWGPVSIGVLVLVSYRKRRR